MNNVQDCQFELQKTLPGKSTPYVYQCRSCKKIVRSIEEDPRRLHRHCTVGTTSPRSLPVQGPGAELERLLHRFGIKPKPGCKCTQRAREMDRRGPDWCEKNLETIIDWLKEESARRKLPFVRAAARVIVKRAIRNARRNPKPIAAPTPAETVVTNSVAEKGPLPPLKRPIKWAYGVTTVLQDDGYRVGTLLPRTLRSLSDAGFDAPHLFVDRASDPSCVKQFRLPTSVRGAGLGIVGNWIMSAWELYLRNPNVDRYAIFQDDLVASRGLRDYLDRCEYPKNGYWNLLTFPVYQKLCKEKVGWFPTSQLGRGAVALVFNREVLTRLFIHPTFVAKPTNARKPTTSIDGAIVEAMKRANCREFAHNPSLVQHTGDKSSVKNPKHPKAPSFRGEEFDLTELLR